MYYYKEEKDGKIVLFCECSQPQTDKIQITKEEYDELVANALPIEVDKIDDE